MSRFQSADRTYWLRAIPLAGAITLIVLLVMVGFAPQAHAVKKRSNTGLKIQSPHNGANLRRGPLSIRIKVGQGARLTGVSLNGHGLRSYFAQPRLGVWSLQASPNYGLRRGANVLRVTVPA